MNDQAAAELEIDRQLMAESGLFDERSYQNQAGLRESEDSIRHYLEKGWRQGLEPNGSFPGTLLRPYFASAGFMGPPAVSWLMMRSAGWYLPTTWNEAQWQAMRVRSSGLFDEDLYKDQLSGACLELDTAIHYLTVGERMGLMPSSRFDPAFYAECYPDVAGAGANCLLHYHDHGSREGRVGVAIKVYRNELVVNDANKENVLVVVHETSVTGAPVLGWNIARELARRYNVYTVRMGDGLLTPEFEALSTEVHGPFLKGRENPTYIGHALKGLLKSRKFRYAIVNSVESRNILEACGRNYIPSLFLMHEFASSVQPLSSLIAAFDWATEIIFPAEVVARAGEEKHPELSGRKMRVLPQGASILPERRPATGPEGEAASEPKPNRELEELTLKRDVDGTFMVLGAGWVQLRKGVDVFVSVAAAVIRNNPQRDIHFVWVGGGYNPEFDLGYSVYLKEQIHRSGLDDHVTFLDAVPDLEPVYRIADAFLLSSRLDPFPNVAIDAMQRGIPMICFKEASGTAEMLSADPETALGVVDHLDAEAAGQVILKLAHDETLRRRMGRATRELAVSRLMDMERYVSQLEQMGTAALERMQQRETDAQTLIGDSTFDQDMFLGVSGCVETRADTVSRYLAMAAARGKLFKGIRRPAAGFNRERYAQEHALHLDSLVDPLADFVRAGKPVGPWFHRVLCADDPAVQVKASGKLRMALHAHFYYPELVSDFLACLQKNSTTCDLLVSTNTIDKAQQLKSSLAGYVKGKVDIRIVPNRGRDIGPLLSEFATDLAKYDLVGHVHAKRTLIVGDDQIGENWRHFVWQNLLGGVHCMMDLIVAAFEQDPSLGLVFPSDPHLISWDENKAAAAELAGRMGWQGPLPDHFDFPLGTMFWTRRHALGPLLSLHLNWNDYPEEPLPYDGTMLHAIERLMPTVCQLAGYQIAVTHVPGVSW